MNVSAVSSKQANVAMSDMQQIRSDLIVETLKPSDSLGIQPCGVFDNY